MRTTVTRIMNPKKAPITLFLETLSMHFPLPYHCSWSSIRSFYSYLHLQQQQQKNSLTPPGPYSDRSWFLGISLLSLALSKPKNSSPSQIKKRYSENCFLLGISSCGRIHFSTMSSCQAYTIGSFFKFCLTHIMKIV